MYTAGHTLSPHDARPICGGLGGLPVLEGAMGLLEGLADPAHLRRRVRGREAAAEEAGAVRRARRQGKVHVNPGLDQRIPHEDGGLFVRRSEEHTSELQSLMRISYAVFCVKKNNTH